MGVGEGARGSERDQVIVCDGGGIVCLILPPSASPLSSARLTVSLLLFIILPHSHNSLEQSSVSACRLHSFMKQRIAHKGGSKRSALHQSAVRWCITDHSIESNVHMSCNRKKSWASVCYWLKEMHLMQIFLNDTFSFKPSGSLACKEYITFLQCRPVILATVHQWGISKHSYVGSRVLELTNNDFRSIILRRCSTSFEVNISFSYCMCLIEWYNR